MVGNESSLKGLIVCKGKVRGKVKLVRTLSDLIGVKGKVIICLETTIEYAPYLKMAVAIVTDHGGINCHTAITAREFKLPCIVGTKIATKVFKDGDLVEVDAEKGVVRKI